MHTFGFDTGKLVLPADTNLKVSFSGGRTSAMMTVLLLREFRDSRGTECAVVFANTGLEHPATYDFVHMCDKKYDMRLTWVEAEVSPRKGDGTRHKVVSNSDYSKNGEPYLSGAAKYGIANAAMPWCTRELKAAAMHSYVRNGLGWKGYTTAIGIRADEMDRVSVHALSKKFLYPLVTLGVTKSDVQRWCQSEGIQLKVPEHLGNCVACWKKADRKLFAVARDMPSAFEPMLQMERLYGNVGAMAARTGKAQVFYRKHRSVPDLLLDAVAYTGEEYFDHSYNNEELDLGGACGESCEPYADEESDNAFKLEYPNEHDASEP